jgi:hypothetical protein
MQTQLKRLPASSITGPVLMALAKRRIAQWDQVAKSPQAIQLDILLSHCQTAAETEFGREHRLGEVKSYEDFKARVPLRKYADFEPYIDRMKAGERDILWPGLISYFGCSSGTSHTAAKNKFLPISWQQIRYQQKAGIDLISRYLDQTGDREFTTGYTIGLFPPSILKPEGRGTVVSSNPGIMMRHLPMLAKLASLPRPPLRDVENYDEKLTRIASEFQGHDVRSISGTSCWFSIFFDRVLDEARKKGRSAQTVDEIWPNLKVLFGGGIYARPYLKLIEERVGRPIVLMDNYNASEGGLFAVTDRVGQDGMLMIPDRGVFFEFVPMTEENSPNPTRVPLWKVEPGVVYSVALTTSSGLFSYLIGDYIKFTSVFPHRMEFSGRSSGVLSLTQELTTAIEIERAVESAVSKNPCKVVDFSAAAEVGVSGAGKGRYNLFVEFSEPPQKPDAFIEEFDRSLRDQNRVYNEHRKHDVGILPPTLISMPLGTGKKFMSALGFSSVQTKYPHIIDEKKRGVLLSLLGALA